MAFSWLSSIELGRKFSSELNSYTEVSHITALRRNQLYEIIHQEIRNCKASKHKYSCTLIITDIFKLDEPTRTVNNGLNPRIYLPGDFEQ